MSETDLPVLAALAEVPTPPVGGAGARFLRASWSSGADAVPQADTEVWATWVELRLWQRPAATSPVDLTARARADLAALAAGLAAASVPEQDRTSRAGLTEEQDARLRTLAALRELGDLSPELQQLRASYRERDQRSVVRPPTPVQWPARRVPGDEP